LIRKVAKAARTEGDLEDSRLEGALAHFQVSCSGKVALDIGASTGGFTDCLLQHGTVKVFAVDVGHGQLAWKIRDDPRVITLEKTNARHLSHVEIPEPVDICVIDVSFISLTLILPKAFELLTPDGVILALIKPRLKHLFPTSLSSRSTSEVETRSTQRSQRRSLFRFWRRFWNRSSTRSWRG